MTDDARSSYMPELIPGERCDLCRAEDVTVVYLSCDPKDIQICRKCLLDGAKAIEMHDEEPAG